MRTRTSRPRRAVVIIPALLLAAVALAGDSAWASPPISLPGGPVIIGGVNPDDRGEFVVGEECRGCGPSRRAEGNCLNSCFTPTCADPTRTTFTGGPDTGEDGGSCRQFDGNQGACEKAWHRTEDFAAASCFWDAGECRGCGRRNGTECTNTCVPPCLDATRTVAAGGPHTNACEQFVDQPTCEQAWHVSKGGLPASCFWDTDACIGCGPKKEAASGCTNTCGSRLPCVDAARTIDTGGPAEGLGAGSCRQFDGNPGQCALAWHTTAGGQPASCFYEEGGNQDGWLYIQHGFDAVGTKVTNTNTLAVCVGCAGDDASAAFVSGFDESTLPGMGWTRTELADPNDVAAFFDDTGAIKISAAGIIYLPSDAGATDGGLTPSRCRGCGPRSGGATACANTCITEPTCNDGTRTLAAGGPRLRGACRDIENQSDCEDAWHVTIGNRAVTCAWNGSRCLGCNSFNADDIGCTNTCATAPTCDDVTRTIFAGERFNGQSGGSCRGITDQTTCEQAWHVSIGGRPGSCFWDGTDCRGCGPANRGGGECTNTCEPPPSCADGGRTLALGGPRGGTCAQLSDDQAACEVAWHVGFGDVPAPCVFEPGLMPIVNANAGAIGEFVANGGGLFAHQQTDIPKGMDWLTTLLPDLVIVGSRGCQDQIVQRAAGVATVLPALSEAAILDLDRANSRFAGDLGGLSSLATMRCLAPPFQCGDASRTTWAGLGRDREGEGCRAFDDDQGACEAAWATAAIDIPFSCFYCQDASGRCAKSGECLRCDVDDIADGSCLNTCVAPDAGFCADDDRTEVFFRFDDCHRNHEGAPDQCARSFEFSSDGLPASCAVCEDDAGRCNGAGDCRACVGDQVPDTGCENECLAPQPTCEDRSRRVFVGGENKGCRQFDGDRKACEKAWHLDDENTPSTCFFCEGIEGKCFEAGECRGCGQKNERAGACANSCGSLHRADTIIGGMRVTFEPQLDHFEGYKLKSPPKLAKDCHLLLDDSNSTAWDGPIEYTASKIEALLAPAGKTDKAQAFPPSVPRLDTLADEATHLVAYKIKRKKGTVPAKHVKRKGVLIENQFGSLRFDTDKEARFLAPANKDHVSSPPMPDGSIDVDHYKCFKIKVAKANPGTQQSSRGKFEPRQALVIDQFENGRAFACGLGSPKGIGKSCKDDKTCGGNKGEFTFCEQGDGHPKFGASRVYDLKKPTQYCVPVEKTSGTGSTCPVTPSGALHQAARSLTCYQKKLASKNGPTGKERISPKQAKHVQRPVFVHSWLAEHELSTKKEETLCVPSLLVEGGTP